MDLVRRLRRCVRWAASLAAALALGLLALGIPSLSGVASAVAPGTFNTAEFDVPSGLAFGGGHLWVTNQAGNSLTEIDPSTGAWMGSFLGHRYGFSHPTAITRVGSDLFVANQTGSLSEVRAGSGAAIRTISGTGFGFVHPIALATSGTTVLVLNAGRPSATPAVAGSISEIDAQTGKLLRAVSGPSFAFDDPIALAVSGPDTYVTDVANNSVTEIDTASGALVRVIAGQGLNTPDGITVADGHVWVSDAGSNAATDIDEATGAVLATFSDSDGQYGFGRPSVAIQSQGDVFIASPFGTSPMVTKLSATTGAPSWYMCNTNGPYFFSLLSAFAVSGDHLWVASRSGANSGTPTAKTGSLTELNTGSGALITTLPLGV
jgi:outer membrane protein assembly factor BamB